MMMIVMVAKTGIYKLLLLMCSFGGETRKVPTGCLPSLLLIGQCSPPDRLGSVQININQVKSPTGWEVKDKSTLFLSSMQDIKS